MRQQTRTRSRKQRTQLNKSEDLTAPSGFFVFIWSVTEVWRLIYLAKKLREQS